MSNAAKRTVGGWLIALGLLCVLVGIGVRGNESDDAEQGRIVDRYARAFAEDSDLPYVPQDTSADRSKSTALFVVAGGAGLAGVILLAGSRPDSASEPKEHEPDK